MTKKELQEIKDRERLRRGRLAQSVFGMVPGGIVLEHLDDERTLIAEVERLREIVEAYLSLDKVEHPEWFKSKEAGPEHHHPLRPGRTP